MFESKYYITDVLEADLSQDQLFQFRAIQEAELIDHEVIFTVRLCQRSGHKKLQCQPTDRQGILRVRCYGDYIVRVSLALDDRPFEDDSPMLDWDNSPSPLALHNDNGSWHVTVNGKTRFTVHENIFAPIVILGQDTCIHFQNTDHFEEPIRDALPGLSLHRADGTVTVGFSVKIAPDEHFCGTGERFDRLDLYGRQFDLINDDARGTNNARTYKNIPFCMSSRHYGIFVHSSAKMRLDIGSHSKQSLQWLTNDDHMDVFFIGGHDLPEILYRYRQITGFPQMPPVWSFGVWMSRMTYRADSEVSAIASRLRDEQYPMDVLHVDTGWFEEDWICDWRFSKTNFPDPPDFFQRMRVLGFRVTLWQYPYINREIDLFPIALENGYIGKPSSDHEDSSGGDSAGSQSWGDTIDFTNPDAIIWYQGLLSDALSQGAAAIKADFGENINEYATYQQIDATLYRNLFALLYQKVVWDITHEMNGNTIIWARAGWAGSQRYPVHWGGDAACSFNGLTASIWGGLHLGLSGFAFWSHDVGGFHGVPDFMNDKPSEQLYARWTQVGVFSSHMRYHGTTPREPWEYPSVADLVRQWLRLRYVLLPYILHEAEQCCHNGMPMLGALVLNWEDDPVVWHIQDEYLFGSLFLVCPILNPHDVRDIYLPDEQWVNFWTGEQIQGPIWLKKQRYPLSRMPLFVRFGAIVPCASPVMHTGELSDSDRFDVVFDDSYTGFETSKLAEYISL